MSGYCTCGAQLPEDARFCHKCGKPQRDEPLLVEEEPVVLAPELAAPPMAQIPPIGFHNRPAVAVALVSGMVAFFLAVLSGQMRLPVAAVLGMMGAGFLAVFLYQRRTGQRLSIIHGAHLGWISGIFGFAIFAVVTSLFVGALSNPAVVDAVREQAKGPSMRPADINQVLEMVHSPSVMLMAMAMMFLMFTVFPAFGGALGAKFLDRHD